MNTPIYDFAKKYAESKPSRMHMPAHKGNVIKLRKSKNSHGIEKDLVTIFMNKM